MCIVKLWTGYSIIQFSTTSENVTDKMNMYDAMYFRIFQIGSKTWIVRLSAHEAQHFVILRCASITDDQNQLNFGVRHESAGNPPARVQHPLSVPRVQQL